MSPEDRIKGLELRIKNTSDFCEEYAQSIENALQHGGELNSGAVLPRVLRGISERLAEKT